MPGLPLPRSLPRSLPRRSSGRRQPPELPEPPSAPPVGPFTHGVASFDPTSEAVLLWTRVDPDAGVEELRWWIRPDGDDRDDGGPRAGAGGTVRPAAGTGVALVDATGLEPGRRYRFGFGTAPDGTAPDGTAPDGTAPDGTAADGTAPDGTAADGTARDDAPRHRVEGRTRTLPAGSPQRWRVALCCCADRSIHHFGVYRAIAEADVDLVVHLGDYVYETAGKGGHRLDPDRTCTTVGDYRRRYAQARSDPALQALHAAHPMVAIWDDHDIADNAHRRGAKAHDPDEHGDWEARLQAAATARAEWVPVRVPNGDPLRQWRSLRVGDLAELVCTDTRIDGRDPQAGEPGAPPLRDPDRALLSPAQRAWLSRRIADTSSTWCLLATAVTMSPLRLGLPLPGALRRGVDLLQGAPSGYGAVDGEAVCTDEWDGYPAERDRVRGWLARRGGGAVVLSGDVHSAWVFDGRRPGEPGADRGELPAAAPELVCPGVSSTPLGRQLPRGLRWIGTSLARRLSAPVWSDLTSWGFVVLEVTPSRVSATWWWVDATDAAAADPAPRRPPSADPAEGPTFVVRRDRPGVERVSPVRGRWARTRPPDPAPSPAAPADPGGTPGPGRRPARAGS